MFGSHSRDEVWSKFKVVLQDNGEVSFRVELEHFLQSEPDVFIDPGRGVCRLGEGEWSMAGDRGQRMKEQEG